MTEFLRTTGFQTSRLHCHETNVTRNQLQRRHLASAHVAGGGRALCHGVPFWITAFAHGLRVESNSKGVLKQIVDAAKSRSGADSTWRSAGRPDSVFTR